MSRLHVLIIAGLARDRTIGKGGDIPWRYPEDFRHFKRTTLGSVLVMGRKTMESIGKPLPGRETIVLTRSPASVEGRWPGVRVATSLEAAIEMAAADGAERVSICGGSAVYAAALDLADEMLLSFVPEDGGGDTFFPEWDAAAWREVERTTLDRVEVVRYVK